MDATLTDLPGFTSAPVAGLPAEAVPPVPSGPRSEVRSVTWRLRHCAVPPVVMAAIACAGAVGQLGPQAALVTAGTYVVVAVVAWVTIERKLKRQARRKQAGRKYRAIITASGLIWLMWADLAGAGSWRMVALLGVGYALALPFALRKSLPNPPARAIVRPSVEVVDSEATRLVRDWADHVSGPGGRLPGSEIRHHEADDMPTGARAVLRLVRGRQSIESVEQAIPVIRTALGYKSITVEQHPSTDDPAVLLLTVVVEQRSATRETVTWDGPALDLKTGLIDVGPYTDGNGVAHWKLITDNSLHGGLIIGDKDSGKSAMTLNVALSAASSGVVSVFDADPDDGASQPQLSRWAYMSAKGLEQIAALVQMVRAGGEFRLMENAANGWEGWDPVAQGRAGVLVVVHEFHKAAAVKSIREDIEFIDRHLRKVGVAVLGETQDSRIVAFGDSDPLRSSLASSNYFATHTQSYNSRDTIPGLKGNPITLPKLPGYAYGSHGCRAQQLRGRYVRAEDGWTDRIRNVAPDAGFINAMGVPYQTWQARVAELDRWRREYVDAVKAGRTPPPRPQAQPVEKAAEKVGEGATGAERMGTLLDFRAPTLVGTGPKVKAREKVLRALGQGIVRTGAIAVAAEVSDTTVRNECKGLIGEGLLQPKLGKEDPWCLTPAGHAAARAVAS